MVIDAVIRNFEVLGEASKKIPDELKEKYSDIPWRSLIGLRNIAIHEYFSLDLENIWKIIREDLPANERTFREMDKEV